MAEKQLKSIKFPGLDDVYIIPEGGSGTIDIELEGSNEGEANPINADTLGGYLASDFATKDEIPDVSAFQTAAQVSALINEALGVIENGSY